ncbi:unnamed protein product [Phyllotreta striolata]|uniref:ZP domain-containing protein n=1 Tax=Phyllotreta striolata TaxID=444603 RepID=A0A9N9XSN0_PHYSR|nr:unnamed protein product [Phyllotreta striolata]
MAKNRLIYALQILTMASFPFPVKMAFPPSLRYPLPIALNKITGLNFTCDSDNFNVSISTHLPFKGLLFAKDFAQECKAKGDMSNKIQLSLPTSGCGVRLSSASTNQHEAEMFYTVNIVIQQDRHLRQISDQEKTIKCPLKDEDLLVKSKALAKTLKQLKDGRIHQRVGRMKNEGWSKELDGKQLEEELNEALSAARAWMEIVPESSEDTSFDTLEVGEIAMLSVKSTLPVGIGWKVVDCIAHDGLGDSSQKLINENGCPVDEALMPALIYGPIRPIALMHHQEAVTRFSAFKFPDRDRLHLSCGLQLCKGECSKHTCGSLDDMRSPRAFSEASEGDVLDRLEVFNSVEVIAPEIDDLRGSERLQSVPETFTFTNIPGDRTFCVSQDKMAIAFCILGMIFLIAIIIAACSLIKSKRDGHGIPYYSRSLFSGSSTSGSIFGSKLLLRESPSPRNSPSHSRGLQYGRIL